MLWNDICKGEYGIDLRKLQLAGDFLKQSDIKPHSTQVPDLIVGTCKTNQVELTMLLVKRFLPYFERSPDNMEPMPLWAAVDGGSLVITQILLKEYGKYTIHQAGINPLMS